jgi:hypothetical protein
VHSHGEISFQAITTLEGREVSECLYAWEILPPHVIESSIDEGTYSAGLNLTGAEVIEYIQVTDTAHDKVTATAQITVTPEAIQGIIKGVFPNTLYRSPWLPMVGILVISGSNCNFDITSRVSFEPQGNITSLFNVGLGDMLFAIVVVEPGSIQEEIDIVVVTGGEEETFYAMGKKLLIIVPIFQ